MLKSLNVSKCELDAWVDILYFDLREHIFGLTIPHNYEWLVGRQICIKHNLQFHRKQDMCTVLNTSVKLLRYAYSLKAHRGHENTLLEIRVSVVVLSKHVDASPAHRFLMPHLNLRHCLYVWLSDGVAVSPRNGGHGPRAGPLPEPQLLAEPIR